MNAESFFKVYEGNRHVGSTRPVVIVTSDTTWKGYPFAEHFIITSLPNNSLIQQSTYYDIDSTSGVTFDDFPTVFSAASLLQAELALALDHLEYTISATNRDLHADLYWSRMPLDFAEVGEDLITRMVLLGRGTDKMQAIFRTTRNAKLREFGESLSKLPKITIHTEPPRT